MVFMNHIGNTLFQNSIKYVNYHVNMMHMQLLSVELDLQYSLFVQKKKVVN
ncbi:Uncharacterised protein [Mycobacteroides abscessus subsp. massiliense]|nr:Uncharacterised protein [Mycobacteroides abscessus subsp. massiliense]